MKHYHNDGQIHWKGKTKGKIVLISKCFHFVREGNNKKTKMNKKMNEAVFEYAAVYHIHLKEGTRK